jgi:ketosteroid isomerase-like protein
MSADDVVIARQFLAVLATAAKTGELEGVYPFLAPDVEWVTPLRDLHTVGAVRDELAWLSPNESLEIDFEEKELADLGGGRVLTDFHETYRIRRTGEFAYARERQIELTIREGKVAKYEIRFAG